jgi:hypothetical protein
MAAGKPPITVRLSLLISVISISRNTLATLANNILQYGSQDSTLSQRPRAGNTSETSQAGERNLLHRFLKSNDRGLLSINAMATSKPPIASDHLRSAYASLAASPLIVAISAPTLEALEAGNVPAKLPPAILRLSLESDGYPSRHTPQKLENGPFLTSNDGGVMLEEKRSKDIAAETGKYSKMRLGFGEWRFRL